VIINYIPTYSFYSKLTITDLVLIY